MSQAIDVEFKNEALKETDRLFALDPKTLGSMVYTVHDQFHAVIKHLESAGYRVNWAKVCGSPCGDPIADGFPEAIEGKDYHTKAHGWLQRYRMSTLSRGRTFVLSGTPNVLVYKSEYAGCGYTPGHQWMISVEC